MNREATALLTQSKNLSIALLRGLLLFASLLLLFGCGGGGGGGSGASGGEPGAGNEGVIRIINSPDSECVISVVGIFNEAGEGFFDDVPIFVARGASKDITVPPGVWDVSVLATIPAVCFHNPLQYRDLIVEPGGVVEARFFFTFP